MKIPFWLQNLLLPYMDKPDLTPTMLRGDNLFATMLNENLKSIEINLKALTVITTYQDDTRGILLHPMDLESLQTLWARFKDKMRMDLAERNSETQSIKDMKVGIIICRQEFVCTHDSHKLTLSLR